MNGIHDVGGMDGFGPVETTETDGTFDEQWEGRAYGAFVAGLGTGAFGIDEFRHAIERMSPADYLVASYYDRWLRAITRLYVEKGILDQKNLHERTEAFAAGTETVSERTDPDILDELIEGVQEAYDPTGEASEPQFEVGDRVIVHNHNPAGHTRCPGYLRQTTGVVNEYRGDHTFPDAAAHGEERTEPLYNVQFESAELWGDRSEGAASVAADLWEPYLKPTEV
jgi:nitrile hydratase